MWSTHVETLRAAGALKVFLTHNGRDLSFAQVSDLWQDDAAFRAFFNELLAETLFPAFRWETPPITKQSSDRSFEFVLLDSPELNVPPDASAFAEHFGDMAKAEGVISFSNLGRDATLVVPYPLSPTSSYGHLAAFVRGAPEKQRHALWNLVGRTLKHQLNSSPIWLSTAGAGVPWLHVRFDQRPKYYRHSPYRVFATST